MELIPYFSRADENYFGGQIKDIKVGNTEILANKVAKITGGTLFKVEPKVPYSKNYNECIEQAKRDLQTKTRPQVVAMPENIEQYDLITIMYPCYWGTMPVHMFTVLEQLDLSGKIIRPICTHEGSRMGSSVRDLKKLFPNAIIKEGLPIVGSNVNNSDFELQQWLESTKD